MNTKPVDGNLTVNGNRPVSLQILSCHNIESTCETRNINDYSVTLKCPSNPHTPEPACTTPRLWKWNPKMNADLNNVNHICTFLAANIC